MYFVERVEILNPLNVLKNVFKYLLGTIMLLNHGLLITFYHYYH